MSIKEEELLSIPLADRSERCGAARRRAERRSYAPGASILSLRRGDQSITIFCLAPCVCLSVCRAELPPRLANSTPKPTYTVQLKYVRINIIVYFRIIFPTSPPIPDQFPPEQFPLCLHSVSFQLAEEQS